MIVLIDIMLSSNKFSISMLSMLLMIMSPLLTLQTSASIVEMTVDPSTIQVGLSPSLDVNCTFSINTTSAMAAIFSLTVSRENNSDLASITSFADHQVNVISSEGITADGVINPGGQSYIHLHWDYPTDTQKGTYQCVARGIDNLGHNVESVNTSVVSVDQVDLQDLVNDFRQMQTYIHQLEQRVESLEFETQHGLSALFYIPPLTHDSKTYYVSKHEFHYFNESMDICKSHEGMLAEIDDEDEYHAIQGYMSETFTGVRNLHIGGRDPTGLGNWVLPSTNMALPFTDWDEDVTGWGDCLCISETYDWRMYPCACQITLAAYYQRYMCEFNAA